MFFCLLLRIDLRNYANLIFTEPLVWYNPPMGTLPDAAAASFAKLNDVAIRGRITLPLLYTYIVTEPEELVKNVFTDEPVSNPRCSIPLASTIISVKSMSEFLYVINARITPVLSS